MQNGFQVKKYQCESPKLALGRSVCAVILADLHGSDLVWGAEGLVERIRSLGPDLVLIAGDMIMRSRKESFRTAFDLLTALGEDFPVFYGMGNHESGLRLIPEEDFPQELKSQARLYRAYERRLSQAGIHILANASEEILLPAGRVRITGLELPMSYYRKPFPFSIRQFPGPLGERRAHGAAFRPPALGTSDLRRLAGGASRDAFQILLAHHPHYAPAYLSWGADLTVCGHYHGGVLRLGEHTGAVSPQFGLFPAFCCGDFHKGSRHLYVSPGLGEHTIPLRIHNPRQLLWVTVRGTGGREAE